MEPKMFGYGRGDPGIDFRSGEKPDGGRSPNHTQPQNPNTSMFGEKPKLNYHNGVFTSCPLPQTSREITEQLSEDFENAAQTHA